MVCHNVIVSCFSSNKKMSNLTYLDSQFSNFHECALKLIQIENTNDEAFYQELNKLLDQLNSCDYSLKVADNQTGEKLLRCCAALVPLDREHLVTKFCPVIIHLIRRQNVVPSKETLSLLLEFLLSVIQRCSHWIHSYALLAVATLLYENSSEVEEFWDRLIGPQGVLVSLVVNPTDPQLDKDVLRCALRCVENLTFRTCVDTYLPPDVIQRCLKIFLTNLQASGPNETDQLLHCKILLSCLAGLQNLINGGRSIEVLMLGELLASLKYYMFYNMPGQSQIPVSRCLYPSPLSQHYCATVTAPSTTVKASSGHPSTKGSAQNWKSRKRQTNTKKRGEKVTTTTSGEVADHSKFDQRGSDGEGSPSRGNERFSTFSKLGWSPRISSSESEYSDSEGGSLARLRSAQSRVRQRALEALTAVVKAVDRKVIFGYWSSFLPDAATSTGTLASCLLKDPAPKVRSGALAVLISMLEGSRQFLALADEREKGKTAFTTLSATLASTVRELHRSLILALISETSPLVLTRIVRCIGVLVQTAPVHKLSEGFLSKIARHLWPLLKHRDSNVEVAALTAFGAIVEIQPPLQEVSKILGELVPSASSCDEQRLDHRRSDALTTSWLVELCLENGDSSTVSGDRKPIPLPIRLESLQVLAAITKNYFINIRPSLSAVVSSIQSGLSDAEASVKLHSAKLLEELGRSVSRVVESETDLLQVQNVVTIWMQILGASLPSALQDLKHPALQAKGCDCIATISAKVFPLLPRQQQVLCETLLLGLSADEDKSIKATATRALGVLVLFPSLREDISLVIDVSETVIAAMEDRNLEVRLKTAWTLGNVTEAIILNKESAAEEYVDELPDTLLCKLMEVALKASQDNDRVRSNGVRALGNLLRYFHSRHLEKPQFQEIVGTAVDSLVKCASSGGNMKVRWNACYALGNMLHNTSLDVTSAPWRGKVFNTLGHLTKDCKNFKVRINAAAALSVPTDRKGYGTPQELSFLWQQLVDGLENIQSSMDFIEYQHHDHLVEQICATMLHLASLLRQDDVSLLFSALGSHTETIVTHLQRYVARAANANVNQKERLVAKVTAARKRLVGLKVAIDNDHSMSQWLCNLLSALDVECTESK